MTALAAGDGKIRNRRGIAKQGTPLAIVTTAVVYQGSLLTQVEASGRLRAAQGSAIGTTFVGVCTIAATKTGTTAGLVLASFDYDHEELFATRTAVTKNYIGCNLAIDDDDTLTTMSAAGSAGLRIIVGEMVEWVTANTAWVAVRRFAYKDAP